MNVQFGFIWLRTRISKHKYRKVRVARSTECGQIVDSSGNLAAEGLYSMVKIKVKQSHYRP
jgi:hypothetical protein